MKYLIILLLIGILIVSGCAQTFSSGDVECTRDEDCALALYKAEDCCPYLCNYLEPVTLQERIMRSDWRENNCRDREEVSDGFIGCPVAMCADVGPIYVKIAECERGQCVVKETEEILR